jgi:hypothetical protein
VSPGLGSTTDFFLSWAYALKQMRALECELADASALTVSILARTRARWAKSSRAPSKSELGNIAELSYAAHARLAVWSCIPRWLRAMIHGGNTRTTRDRGVDAVGVHLDGRLVLAQVRTRASSCNLNLRRFR